MMKRLYLLFALIFLTTTALVAEELTPLHAEAFFDDYLTQQIQEANIAGVVVALVNRDGLLFTKGYGYADVAAKTPISPEETLFRPGSISKLLTSTAVMQLVEQGKLDLDRDVNDYLDFKIPSAFDQPITLRQLLTHRAGFEETMKDLFVSAQDELQPLSHYLQTHLPQQIYPAGEVPAYSNYGMTLAGYIVERVSGENFYYYMEDHLLKPLEMSHTTFRQNLDNLKDVSKGYTLSSKEPMPFEIIQGVPAGALSASAVDMSHFMIMHYRSSYFYKFAHRSIATIC